MQKLILLLAILIPATAMAQESSNHEGSSLDGIFVVDDLGKLITINPTPELTLNALQAQEESGNIAARAVLRQSFKRRSYAELDVFANDLGRLILETPSYDIASGILWTLRWVSDKNILSRGIPYERGLEVLIDVYERMDGTEAIDKGRVLHALLYSGGIGEAYVRDLFESSEPPKKPCWLSGRTIAPPGEELGPEPDKEEWCPYKTQWCETAILLIQRERVESEPFFKAGISDGSLEGGFKAGIDPDLVYPLCDKRIPKRDGEWGLFPVLY